MWKILKSLQWVYDLDSWYVSLLSLKQKTQVGKVYSTMTVRPHCLVRDKCRKMRWWGMTSTRLCVCTPTNIKHRPRGIFVFPLSELYKQTELEKSSHWNISLRSDLCFPCSLWFQVYLIRAITKGQTIRHVVNKPLSKAVPRLDRLIMRCRAASGFFFFFLISFNLAATCNVKCGG